MKVPRSHIRVAATEDDHRDDPDNPIVPFRMSDRLLIYGIQVKMNVVLALVILVAGAVGAGMALKFL